jgi:transposase
MQLKLKTLLNLKEHHPDFVYEDIRLVKEDTITGTDEKIAVNVVARKNSQGKCSGCNKKCPCYDHLPQRKFIHVPLWGLTVIFLYCMRRVQCKDCGIIVESVPWAEGKSPLTKGYSWFLSEWAKLLSIQEVARQFKSSWHHVLTAVSMAVTWGRERMDLSDIAALGVDEIHWGKKGFMTLVYQIDNHCKRLLWCSAERTSTSINSFFDWFGESRSALLKFICSDMWKPYLKAVKERAQSALNILDRFHVSQKLNNAINDVRASETKDLVSKGKEVVLRNSRWVFLKNPENLTDKQKVKLKDLLACNLKTIRAYLLKEDFKSFWDYTSATWAGKFLDIWCTQVMRSKLKPMKKVAKTIRSHKQLLLNWFEVKNKISLGAVEGLNNKSKVVIRKSYGFKTADMLKMMLYHKVGGLPVPQLAHKYF